jgi:hypothetical protein
LGSWTNVQTLVYTNFVDSLEIYDLNGDGFQDVVVSATDPISGAASLRSYPGGPAGFGSQALVVDNVEFTAFTRLADLNADGLVDVIGGETFHLGAAGGGFHPGQAIWMGVGNFQNEVNVADFNRDGKMDLMTGLSVLLQK